MVGVQNIEARPSMALGASISIWESTTDAMWGLGEVVVSLYWSGGDKSSCPTMMCAVSIDSSVYSERDGMQSLMHGLRVARSSVFEVKDLVCGRSCRVGSWLRPRLDIHSLMLGYEDSQITRRAKSVTN